LDTLSYLNQRFRKLICFKPSALVEISRGFATRYFNRWGGGVSSSREATPTSRLLT
jgi:hypothetical protein